MTTAATTPKRHAVSIVIHSDGYLEAYVEKNVDVRFVRVPVAHTRRGELIAEDCARMMMPRRYSELWRADYLRANTLTAPLTAETALNALAAKDCIATLAPHMPPKPSRKGAA